MYMKGDIGLNIKLALDGVGGYSLDLNFVTNSAFKAFFDAINHPPNKIDFPATVQAVEMGEVHVKDTFFGDY
jgi:hypothetical protein